MAKLMYQGHGSFRIVTDAGAVVYVDPYAGEGYDLPADLVLVSHEHGDHNRVELCKLTDGGKVLRAADFIDGGSYRTYTVAGVTVTAVPAANRNHDPKCCVGFLIMADGVKVYAACDTSRTGCMEKELPEMKLDWALLPTDGIYNMGVKEAAECAALIGARHTVPIHMKPGALFDEKTADKFQRKVPSAVICRPGDEVTLD